MHWRWPGVPPWPELCRLTEPDTQHSTGVETACWVSASAATATCASYKLLVHGARAVFCHVGQHNDNLSQWIRLLATRKPTKLRLLPWPTGQHDSNGRSRATAVAMTPRSRPRSRNINPLSLGIFHRGYLPSRLLSMLQDGEQVEPTSGDLYRTLCHESPCKRLGTGVRIAYQGPSRGLGSGSLH